MRDTIRQKVLDGDLDESNLSLRDLNLIAESFNKVLNGAFHHRPDYPRPEEIESAENDSSEGNRDRGRGAAANGKESSSGSKPTKATAS